MQEKEYSKISNSPLWVAVPLILFAVLASIYFNRFDLDFFTEGDLGRDLYKYYLVSKGLLPYVDFNWIYGPLTPFLYGMLFKIFGVSIYNAAFLWYFFFFLCTALIFYLVKTFSNYFIATITSLFFIAYYGMTIITFNHIVGSFFIIVILILLKWYLSSKKSTFLYLVSVFSFLLIYTKLNMGLMFVIPIYSVLLIYNYINKNNQKETIKSIICFILLTFIFYVPIILSAPADQIAKSFPFLNNTMMAGRLISLKAILSADAISMAYKFINNQLIFQIFYLSSLNIWYFVAIIISVIYSIFYFRKNGFNEKLAFILILMLTSLFCMNEFVMVSSYYSLRYWVMPEIIVLMAFIINLFLVSKKDKSYFKWLSILIIVFLLIPLSVKLYTASLYVNFPSVKTNQERISINLYDKEWLNNLDEVNQYVNSNLDKKDTFFSFPYNSIYNFILKRDFPSRNDEFLLISGLNEKDEIQVINDLEANKVKAILYNPLLESTSGVGSLGVTHGKLLYKYINLNYTVAKMLKHTPNGIPFVILKRATPFVTK